jgi:hypothetical protein
MNSRMYLTNRYKRFFSQKWRHIFSTSLILSTVDYCLPVWGNLSETKYQCFDNIMLKISSLVVLNKKIDKSKFYSAMEQMNWLTVAERYEMTCMNFLAKHISNESSLTRCFPEFQKRQSKISLRNTNNFDLPRMKTEFGRSSFFYQSTNMWNNLPQEMRTEDNFMEFDKKIHHLLVDKRNDQFKYSNNRIIH